MAREKLCSVPNCGRPFFARGLCQTHDRQLRTTGELRPIRHYRTRAPGTVKLAGHRVSASSADVIRAEAKRRKRSLGALISEIVEGWAARRKKR